MTEKGILYGVGVGPGDPELLTLKAIRTMRECDVIAIPGKSIENSRAYRIIEHVAEEIDLGHKEILLCPYPMSKDRDILEKAYRLNTQKVAEKLAQGVKIAFITIGDPTIYSTYGYLHSRIADLGYQTQIISGVPSFCAVSAALGDILVEHDDLLHIIPGSYDISDVKTALSLPGTKVLMKSGKQIQKVRNELEALDADIQFVENCGMPDEKIGRDASSLSEDMGYLTTIIIK